ncbi:MAG: patatin-like phospholipase family protein [Flavobacteriales bacterium]|nr:patatin-like phospholipase family protein [Flavobacteriales bacterium]
MGLTIENLVFQGGGVKGIAYAGAIQSLKNHDLLNDIRRVAGTSAGASTALLLSLHYSPAEIREIVANTNFSDFEDHWNPLRIPTHYGIYKGENLLNWLRDGISRKGLKADATFSDFRKQGCLDLKVFATNLNKKTAVEFSYHATPKVQVAHAVRASMGAPLFFQAWQFPDGNPDSDIYVDGGTVMNYPITAFDENGEVNPRTVGFHLDNLSGPQDNNELRFDELAKYVRVLFDAILHAQTIDFNFNTEEKAHSVRIDDFGISATKFDLPVDEQHKLFESGLKATDAYIREHNLVHKFGGAVLS